MRTSNIVAIAITLTLWTTNNALSVTSKTGTRYHVVEVSASDPDGLNLRAGPNSRSARVGHIPHNATNLIVHECVGGEYSSGQQSATWCRISYMGQQGWVNEQYIAPMSSVPQIQLNRASLHAKYIAINRYVSAFMDKRDKQLGVFTNEKTKDWMVSTRKWCGTFQDSYKIDMPQGAITTALTEMAFAVHSNVPDLRRGGYPDSILRQTERAFVNAELDKISRGEIRSSADIGHEFLDMLVNNVDKYIEFHHLHLSKVSWNNQCGGPGPDMVAVQFRASPPTGTIWLIPRFDYEFCRHEGVNADDRRKCDGWRVTNRTGHDMVLGDYILVAIWGKKASEPTPWRADDHQDGSTFTLAEP